MRVVLYILNKDTGKANGIADATIGPSYIPSFKIGDKNLARRLEFNLPNPMILKFVVDVSWQIELKKEMEERDFMGKVTELFIIGHAAPGRLSVKEGICRGNAAELAKGTWDLSDCAQLISMINPKKIFFMCCEFGKSYAAIAIEREDGKEEKSSQQQPDIGRSQRKRDAFASASSANASSASSAVTPLAASSSAIHNSREATRHGRAIQASHVRSSAPSKFATTRAASSTSAMPALAESTLSPARSAVAQSSTSATRPIPVGVDIAKPKLPTPVHHGPSFLAERLPAGITIYSLTQKTYVMSGMPALSDTFYDRHDKTTGPASTMDTPASAVVGLSSTTSASSTSPSMSLMSSSSASSSSASSSPATLGIE